MTNAMLSPEEVLELKNMCANPFLELGMTLRPEHLACFERKIVTHNIKVVILFEEHLDSEKWNKMHETRIRKGGHMATIALSSLLYALGGGAVVSIGFASALAITKDEVQAQIWYPKMFKGWRLTRYYDFHYQQFPQQHFYMSWTDVIQNEKGEERERRNFGQTHFAVGGPYGIPEKLVRDVMTRFPVHTIKYK